MRPEKIPAEIPPDSDDHRLVTCRYLRRSGDQCTAEAVDDQAELLICTKHLARAVTLLQEAGVSIDQLLAAGARR